MSSLTISITVCVLAQPCCSRTGLYHADPCLARGKGLAERQMSGGRPLQVRRRARGELLGADLGVIQAPERLDEVGIARLGLGFHIGVVRATLAAGKRAF